MISPPVDIKGELSQKILSEDNIISTLKSNKFGKDGTKSHSCDQCEYKTNQIGYLRLHVNSIHEGQRFSCNQCKYKATQESSLKKHIQSIHEGKRYPCDQCEYQATQTCNLRTHKALRHQA